MAGVEDFAKNFAVDVEKTDGYLVSSFGFGVGITNPWG